MYLKISRGVFFSSLTIQSGEWPDMRDRSFSFISDAIESCSSLAGVRRRTRRACAGAASGAVGASTPECRNKIYSIDSLTLQFLIKSMTSVLCARLCNILKFLIRSGWRRASASPPYVFIVNRPFLYK